MSNKCIVCGEPGELAQAPYPLPYSECYCNICYELESIAYSVWRNMYPEIHKFNAPVPIMESQEDIPPDCLSLTLEQVKDFFRSKLENKQ